MKKLKFYKMNSEYIDYLKSFDRSVPDVRYQAHDKIFCGPICIEDYEYYAPITSRKMDDRFHFLIEFSSEPIASIDFLHMIPVPKFEAKVLDFRSQRKDYRMLVSNEYRVITKYRKQIHEMAKHTYQLYLQNKVKHCCKFHTLAYACSQWENQHLRQMTDPIDYFNQRQRLLEKKYAGSIIYHTMDFLGNDEKVFTSKNWQDLFLKLVNEGEISEYALFENLLPRLIKMVDDQKISSWIEQYTSNYYTYLGYAKEKQYDVEVKVEDYALKIFIYHNESLEKKVTKPYVVWNILESCKDTDNHQEIFRSLDRYIEHLIQEQDLLDEQKAEDLSKRLYQVLIPEIQAELHMDDLDLE